MSVLGILKVIETGLDYHWGEFRTLSEPAQRDLKIIRYTVKQEIAFYLESASREKARIEKANGADGVQQPVRPTKLQARAKLKGRKKTK